MLAREVRDELGRLADSVAQGGRARLASLLGELFLVASERRPDGSARLTFAMTVEQMGDAIGSAREPTARLLAGLIQEGAIARDGKGWLIAPAQSRLLWAEKP